MKKLHLLILTTIVIAGLAACNSGGKRRNPGKAYAMDMTYATATDYYSQYDPSDSSFGPSRLPVSGTIARGHQLPDHLMEGDTNSYKTFNTSMKFTAAELKEGGRLYDIHCGICHGAAMDGNGPLYADGNGKFAAKPANLKDPNYVKMSVGQIYAAIKYGKNMMGSYASQLDIQQRWMVIAHIKQLQAEAGGNPFTMGMNDAAAPSSKDTASGTKTAAVATDSMKAK